MAAGVGLGGAVTTLSRIHSPPTTMQHEAHAPMNQNHHPVVYRQLAIPVSTFDRIKDYQRTHAERTGQRLTIIQTITAIVREHQQIEEHAEQQRHDNKQPAILRGH